jgi:UDP-2,3-diacylglucosamine hydrolase
VIHFISDLHLSPQTPGAMTILGRFLREISHPENRLYILGDFFEIWIGDDSINDPFNAQVIHLLQQARSSGLFIGVLHGNRDFLLGNQFAVESGVSLLLDPFILSTPEWQFILSHGDALCTNDVTYQAFRTQVRNPTWQSAFLSKSLEERKLIAFQMRERSIQAHHETTAYLSDLTQSDTDDFLRQYGYATLIHGHTHQPATHDHMVDGIHVERWVLADWQEHRGESLIWDGRQLSRLALQ